ncbi:WG containing repeat-containing protein [Polaribacter sp. KT25b]|uniref:WG repeat-containing protein n=1 Tax=Polaribacter sp. KT25b TaxID=1855336 RepID=UPI00087C39D4|nr:WG repeat-containing protein [Polaribacter sp. KT25b]SDS58143.1 WG containing repeat-containing protein [Polaribacter sp. KT25b]
MKKAIILFFLIPFLGFSQITDKLDYVSPFNEGYSAVKKGNQWAFINQKGNIVIDFRDDLVLTETNKEKYPIFVNERCLISEKKDGISYFGFIDTSGKTVVEPLYLNAANFNEEFAIVIHVYKNLLGKDVLNKQVVSYEITEILINKSGEVKFSLTEPKGIILSKEYIKNPPKINSKFLTKNLIAVLGKDNKWELKKL